MGRRELLAALAAFIIGVPMVFLLGRALADGLARHQHGAIRTLLGNETFEKLQSGEETPRHYFGNEYRAPDFTLPDRHGNPWKLSEHRGKVIVLNFWSITCPPCVEEMPTLEELSRFAQQWEDIEVVTVSTDSGWKEVRSVLSKNSQLEVLFDPDKSVVKGKFGTRLYPETWIIDKRGVIRMRYDGMQDWSSPLAIEVIKSFR
jgi:peroxiredoxin